MCAWFFKTELSNERRARVYEDECQNEERWKKRSSAEKLREKLICHPNFFVLFSNNMFFHDEAKITRNRKEPTPGFILSDG